MRTRFATTAFIALLVAMVPQPRPAHAKEAAKIRFEPYSYKTREGRKIDDAEIGRLRVPENRAKPGGRMIELAFIRFRSTAEVPGPPIVWLAGGPGDYGSDDIEGPYLELVRAFQKVADVIALDQRGTGLSRPNLACDGPEIDLPLAQPLDREALLAASRGVSRACAERWKKEGVDLSAYNTDESADDIEDLRAALGAPKISLYGASYGTHLAFNVLRRHGDRIERVVLSGVEGPDQTWKLPSELEAHFARLAAEYRADSLYGDSIPDLVALMKRVMDRFDRAPVTIATADGRSVTAGGFELRLANRYFLGSRENAARLGGIYLAMERGHYSSLAGIAVSLRKVSAFSAMHDCMNCASGASAQRLARIRAESAAPGMLIGSATDFPGPEVCDSWPYRDLGDAFRAPPRSTVPTLFVSGTLDGHTPPSNVEELIGGFPNGEHLIVERGSHQRLEFAAPGVVERMAGFLKGEKAGGRWSAPPLEFPRPAPTP
jgi:pimeloyl-ACP methyl ester carboxylesterase